MLVARPRAAISCARLAGTGARAPAARGPRRHRRRPRRARAAAPRRRPAGRLGHDRHEGRRRPRARRPARARARAASDFAEVALLLVGDEEWRSAPFAPRRRASRASTPACASRRASSTPTGGDAVVVKRKAAGTMRITAHGPLGALGLVARHGRQRAARARRGGRRRSPPARPRTARDQLTAVPTVVRAGDAFNVVPAAGELICDVRADRLDASTRCWPRSRTRSAARR